MTLAYDKGAQNEADPLSRRRDFIPQAIVPLFWDGEVPSKADLQRKSKPLLNDAQLNVMIVKALRLGHEFANLIREGSFKAPFYGDEGEWTIDSRIAATYGYCWRLERLCVPRNSELRPKLILELYDS
jgi:hypothetical protein